MDEGTPREEPEQKPEEGRPLGRALRVALSGSALFAVATLFSRVLGMAREGLAARYFGLKRERDLYLVAHGLGFQPVVLVVTVANAALLPVLAWAVREQEAAATGGLRAVLLAVTPLLLGYAVVTAGGASRLGTWLVGKTQTTDGGLLRRLIRISTWYVPLAGVGNVVAVLPLAAQRYVVPALAYAVPNVAVLGVLIALNPRLGIMSLALGDVAGGLLFLLVIGVYTCVRWRGCLRAKARWDLAGRFGVLALPPLLQALAAAFAVVLERSVMARLPAGTLAAYDYSYTLTNMALNALIAGPMTVIASLLAYEAAAQDRALLRRRAEQTLMVVILVTVLAASVLLANAEEITRLVYQGQSFDEAATHVTAGLLLWHTPPMLAYSTADVLSRVCNAMQDTLTPVLLGSVSAVIFIPLNYVLMRAMGTGGLALATTIAATLHFFGLTFFLRKRLDGIEGGRVLTSVLRVCVAALLMGIACWGTRLGMERSMGTVAVRPDSLMRPAAIASRLVAGSDPVSRQIGARYLDENERIATDHATVARVLNRAILGPSLYSERTFAGTNLSPKTRTLLRQQDLQGAALAGLNRRLLEDAFAGDIKRIGHTPSDSRKGSVLMVLVTMLVCLVVYVPMLKVLKVEEADFVWSALRRRLGRKGA